ncbi:MAG: flagellar M-ring protein FliF C-terminal domain-containing protein, partial [Pseudomonadota bacterium]
VMALLHPIVGAGNAAVEITLDMDFTRSEITSEEFSPDTALRSEQNSQQVAGGRGAIGIPGAVSNTPPPEPDLVEEVETAEAATTTNSTTSSTRNYEVSRRVETRQPQVASITRVYAAVLLHELPPAATGGEEEESGEVTAAAAAQDALLQQVDALTRSAIGFDEERGDMVTVATARFVETAPLIASPAWYQQAWLPSLGRGAAQLAILAIVVLGIIRPLLQRLLPPAGGLQIQDMSFGDAVEVQRGESFSALRQRIETATPSVEDLDGSLSYEEKIDVVRQLAGDETNRIAGVFKGMLTPEDEVAR